MLAGKLHLKLKRVLAKQVELPPCSRKEMQQQAEKFMLKLRNRFKVLKHSQDAEE